MSLSLFNEAKRYIPGGVNSPVRSFSGVHDDPVFIKSAKGPYIFDSENKQYIDYVCSWGPLITGHADQDIIQAVKKQMDSGLSFGAPTEIETDLAIKICDLIPSIDLVRLVSSGTEATMSAVRLARGYTKKNKIIKFEGCYHGHVDSLLIKAGSGALTLGHPTSSGIPNSLAQETIVLPYNNAQLTQEAFEKWGDDIAGVIVEPVAGNMSCVLPNIQFLSALRDLCSTHNALLIFDEVMTGFRVSLSGAQGFFDIQPDITTLGKVIGGGLPVGAFGGKKEIMECIAPLGSVYQAGTLSGNPLSVSAGLAMLKKLSSTPELYTHLDAMTQKLCQGLEHIASTHQLPFVTQQIGSMFGMFFGVNTPPTDFDEVCSCNIEHYKTFHASMLSQGFYFAPSAYETAFMNTCINDSHINKTLDAANIAMKKISQL